MFWDIIKSEIGRMIRYVYKGKKQNKKSSQRKQNNLKLVENWDPKFLVIVDYRIIPRLLAKIFKIVMNEITFGVIGNSSVTCNNNLWGIV